MKWRILYLALALPVAWPAVPVATPVGDVLGEQKTLIDFSDADRSEWYVINDGVMGGVSQSDIRRTDQGTGVFAGVLSLENNGGFASVRVVVGLQDLSTYAGLEFRVRGDGRAYQLRLRTNDGFDGIAYRAHFETLDGEWTTKRIPFDEFLPTFRGRTLRDAPPLDTSRIRQLSFMLADKKPGPFSLEIDFVRTIKP
jgi:monofunctional biosynthetic peptidoglycan transglycosylase